MAFSQWPLDCLANYSGKKMQQTLCEIQQAIAACFYAGKKPDFAFLEIKKALGQITAPLFAHLKREEELLGPLIAEILLASEQNQAHRRRPFFLSTEAIIGVLENEHALQRIELSRITALVCGNARFSSRSGRCEKLIAATRALQENLEEHIYLQSKLLFPKLMLMKYMVC